MKVLVTGSTGFVGRGILPRLAEAGHETVCLVRPGSEAKLGAVQPGSIRLAAGDLFEPAALAQALAGCEAVIHLVGIIRENPRKGVTFSRIHVEGTRRLLDAAKQAGVKRFIHMSALGARMGAASPYHRTKYEAEQLVIHSGIPYTIFRPSVIFGPDDEFVNMLAGLVRLPVTPVIGDGAYRLQPVARQTVADVFTQALTHDRCLGEIYEAGGPEPLSYNALLDQIGAALGKTSVRKLHLPLGLMKPVINLLEGFSFFPITNTQLTMLLEENVCADPAKLYETFPTPPIPFRQGIERYLHPSART
ncbi:complex I NDUFA9 subunit family protein [Brevibacillus sp. SYP-B805]|uniref:SDR family oxidoreductase n=1 Tax=Brevibacillus sp. SYP-B805 TaxID=1578199 RepID=UPI0013EBEF4D|nr:complex I NDUFA9 subunit family protein [Brevibacillus sp. SYP-B805]NGQ97361.1 complex I NDUFA9 subunit family protein [Brevibacillus sp. SYP-B805]